MTIASRKFVRHLTAIGGLAALCAGCKVGPNYEPPRVTVLDQFGEQGREPTTRPDETGAVTSRLLSGRPPVVAWWTTFNDETLDRLIARAADENLDLKSAETRVREARALRVKAAAGLFPSLNSALSYEHVRPSQNGVAGAFGGGGGSSGGGVNIGGGGAAAPGAGGSSAIPSGGIGEFDLYQAGFDASWELDVFGGTRRSVEAADASLQASIEDRRDVLLTLLGDVAREYVDLRGLQTRLKIAKANLATQAQTRNITAELVDRGLTTQLDLSRAQAQVATTEAAIPPLETSIGQSMHRLSVLLGDRPTALAAELSVEQVTPGVPDDVPVGLPSELLRRRPDIRRAERQLAAATASVGVATADLYPRFSLTGSLGLQSIQPGDLANWASRYSSIGPSVSLPIFDAGRRRAELAATKARRERAGYAFQKSVLVALRDVEDALIAYQKIQQRTRSLREAVESNRQSVHIAEELYKQGIEDFLNVLDAQRSLFAAEDALASAETERSTDLVTLYKSLGGGWELSELANVYGSAPAVDIERTAKPISAEGTAQPK